MSKTYNVAVLGATGAVGETMLAILAQRNFPVGTVFPLASERSAGKTIEFKGQTLGVLDVAGFDWSQAQIGLFSAGASVSAHWAPIAARSGCVIVDNTSQFRYQDDIHLVVPEVNPEAIALYKNHGIIANPNCSTIQMLVALKPIHDAVGIERINVCTYQAVSGTGKKAIDELSNQTVALLSGKPVKPAVYPKQIAFNVLPHIDVFQEN
ncbi:MAG: aspartate-semialdehyde dehydrogenase, partial [Candidatus Methylumidiphilus sp.]